MSDLTIASGVSAMWTCLNSSKDLFANFLSQVLPVNKQVVTSAPVMDPSVVIRHMAASPWIKVAAVSGALSVAMGAYGAHGLKNSDKRVVFETANKYHFYHSIALLATPFLNKPNLVGTLFLAGILIFSGTCYCNAITENTQVVRFTPIGGFAFILGWLSILF